MTTLVTTTNLRIKATASTPFGHFRRSRDLFQAAIEIKNKLVENNPCGRGGAERNLASEVTVQANRWAWGQYIVAGSKSTACPAFVFLSPPSSLIV